jgi:deoxynucleoside triphosphate triphosphohydrolase SAMHD1
MTSDTARCPTVRVSVPFSLRRALRSHVLFVEPCDSSVFDGHFIRHIRPDCGWDHEHASASLLDYLIDDNSLWPTLAAHGLVEADITFIKELIFGGPSGAPAGWVWTGRGVAKAFLFEIVANKRNGIDVDKFDYFARDCHQLGMKWSFDALRLMRFCRVLTVDGSPQICYHEKEVL